jgi:hypothetical protein
MSVASIDYRIDETSVEDFDGEVADATAWVGRRASLRRPFTPGGYVPRHRADVPEPRHRADGRAV